jgi:cob(I)alamin adenosyltransferase
MTARTSDDPIRVPVVRVGAAVLERDGRLLVTRRLEGTHLAGYWEFPGGKCREDETLAACLAREIREELDSAVDVGREILATRHAYPERVVELHFFQCALLTPARAVLGQEMLWVRREDLGGLLLPPADRELVEHLAGIGTPVPPPPDCRYNSCVKIYTRTGDNGDTSLFDGTRVPKSDARVDAYGEVDELSAMLGLVRALGVDADVSDPLAAIQRDLFALGAKLADPAARIAGRVEKVDLGADDAARLEGWIDTFEAELPPLRHFIHPGGCQAGATLHLARTVCRRAERRMVALEPGGLDPYLLVYMNRLSDLLFVLARVVNKRAGVGESEW